MYFSIDSQTKAINFAFTFTYPAIVLVLTLMLILFWYRLYKLKSRIKDLEHSLERKETYLSHINEKYFNLDVDIDEIKERLQEIDLKWKQ